MQRCVVAALNPWSTRGPSSLHAEGAGHDITVLPPLMVGTGGTEKGHCYQNDPPHLSTPRLYKYTAKGAMDSHRKGTLLLACPQHQHHCEKKNKFKVELHIECDNLLTPQMYN